jgi:hypothetical protein
MNCKPGDWAKYVGSEPRLRGMVVLVVKQHPMAGKCLPEYYVEKETWWVEPEIPFGYDDQLPHGCVDRVLQPFTPPEGQDETLTWREVPKPAELAPKPQKEFAR